MIKIACKNRKMKSTFKIESRADAADMVAVALVLGEATKGIEEQSPEFAKKVKSDILKAYVFAADGVNREEIAKRLTGIKFSGSCTINH